MIIPLYFLFIYLFFSDALAFVAILMILRLQSFVVPVFVAAVSHVVVAAFTVVLIPRTVTVL